MNDERTYPYYVVRPNVGGRTVAVDVLALHTELNVMREVYGWSWRRLASELGMSTDTLTRLGDGLRPSVDVFAAVVSWLEADANRFIVNLPEA